MLNPIQIKKFHLWLINNHQSFVPNIFLYRIIQIFVDIFAKNMKGWSDKSKILCIEQSGRAEKNTRKQKNYPSSPSLSKYFPNIFLSPGYSKIFAAVFFSKSLFNWSPHFITSFCKPVKIQTDSCTAFDNSSTNIYIESETEQITTAKYFV